jgi:hypothetical protein
MARCRFVHVNQVWQAGVTLTASAEATGYPATNLLSPKRTLPWRSTTGTGHQTMTIAFASAQTIKVIALVNWRGHTGGTIKAEYWTGSAWANFGGGTGLFTLPASNRTRLVARWDATGVSTTQIRITFTNTAAANEYVELGTVVAGDYFAPTVNVNEPLGYVPIDPSLSRESEGGQETIWERQPYLSIDAAFEFLPAADTDTLRQIFDAVGRRTPIVLALDPDDVDQTLYGRLAGMPTQHGTLDQWHVRVPFQEAR